MFDVAVVVLFTAIKWFCIHCLAYSRQEIFVVLANEGSSYLRGHPLRTSKQLSPSLLVFILPFHAYGHYSWMAPWCFSAVLSGHITLANKFLTNELVF